MKSEQTFNKNKYEAIAEMVRQIGFDNDTLDDNIFDYTEFMFMPLFDLIVEQCAQVAENHSVNYSGENNEAAGCKGAADAIRVFGKMIGTRREVNLPTGPIREIYGQT